jgi:hypothetical protein
MTFKIPKTILCPKGSAIVETLLTLPIILFLLLGTVQIAQIYRNQIQLDFACFRAARAAIVYADQENWLEPCKESAERAMKGPLDFSLHDLSLKNIMKQIQNFMEKPDLKLTFEETEEEIQVGSLLSLKLEYLYELPFPFVAKIFADKDSDSGLTLISHCTLNSEVGSYVEEP